MFSSRKFVICICTAIILMFGLLTRLFLLNGEVPIYVSAFYTQPAVVPGKAKLKTVGFKEKYALIWESCIEYENKVAFFTFEPSKHRKLLSVSLARECEDKEEQ